MTVDYDKKIDNLYEKLEVIGQRIREAKAAGRLPIRADELEYQRVYQQYRRLIEVG